MANARRLRRRVVFDFKLPGGLATGDIHFWKMNLIAVSSCGTWLFIGKGGTVLGYRLDGGGNLISGEQCITLHLPDNVVDVINQLRIFQFNTLDLLVCVCDHGSVAVFPFDLSSSASQMHPARVDNLWSKSTMLVEQELRTEPMRKARGYNQGAQVMDKAFRYKNRRESSWGVTGCLIQNKGVPMSLLAVSANSRDVAVWDMAAAPQEKLYLLKNHDHNIPCVTLSPRGGHLASCSIDMKAKVTRLRDRRVVSAAQPCTQWCWSLAWIPRDSVLVDREMEQPEMARQPSPHLQASGIARSDSVVSSLQVESEFDLVVHGSADEEIWFEEDHDTVSVEVSQSSGAMSVLSNSSGGSGMMDVEGRWEESERGSDHGGSDGSSSSAGEGDAGASAPVGRPGTPTPMLRRSGATWNLHDVDLANEPGRDRRLRRHQGVRRLSQVVEETVEVDESSESGSGVHPGDGSDALPGPESLQSVASEALRLGTFVQELATLSEEPGVREQEAGSAEDRESSSSAGESVGSAPEEQAPAPPARRSGRRASTLDMIDNLNALIRARLATAQHAGRVFTIPRIGPPVRAGAAADASDAEPRRPPFRMRTRDEGIEAIPFLPSPVMRDPYVSLIRRGSLPPGRDLFHGLPNRACGGIACYGAHMDALSASRVRNDSPFGDCRLLATERRLRAQLLQERHTFTSSAPEAYELGHSSRVSEAQLQVLGDCEARDRSERPLLAVGTRRNLFLYDPWSQKADEESGEETPMKQIGRINDVICPRQQLEDSQIDRISLMEYIPTLSCLVLATQAAAEPVIVRVLGNGKSSGLVRDGGLGVACTADLAGLAVHDCSVVLGEISPRYVEQAVRVYVLDVFSRVACVELSWGVD